MIAIVSAHAAAQSPTLPDWFERARVQAHSEHNVTVALALTPAGHAKTIRSLGADVLCRIYKTREEGAWWQTKFGETVPQIGKREFATEISDAVHAEGMKVIAYYRHMCDDAMEKAHPDWICRHPGGAGVREPRGKGETPFVLCMNSPYRDYTKGRLLELADRGVDGIYFDSWHMPDVCVCEHCKAAFLKETGRELNVIAPPGTPSYLETDDPKIAVAAPGAWTPQQRKDYLEAVDFVNRTMVRTFAEWREAVRARRPEVMFVIKSSIYPLFTTPHIDTRLLAISDTSGTEFDKAFGGNTRAMVRDPDFADPPIDVRIALGWSLVRDGAQGRPPLMWVPHLRSERTALYSAAAAVTYGCAPQMNITLRDNLETEGAEARKLFAAPIAMGKKVGPYLAHARPIPWAAIHISPAARNARLGDLKLMWREFFAPAIGACQALKEEHLPWATLADDALARGPVDDTKLLVLPWPDELDAEQRAAVERFEKAGGIVVRLDPNVGWNSQAKRPALLAALKGEIRQRASSMAAPPARVSGPEAMHAVVFRGPEDKGLVVCLSNTWGWFRSTREPDPAVNEGAPPPPCRDAVIELAAASQSPRRGLEAVTGKELAIETSGAVARIRVPEFQINACVVVEY